MTPTEHQQQELESTTVSRPTAIVMSCAFMLILIAIPLLQIFDGSSSEAMPPRTTDALLSSAYYRNYEETLERKSRLIHQTRPLLQEFISRFGNFGNDRVTVGKNDWLFYQPGIRYVYGPNFMETTGPTPDEAIIQLHNDCERLGIHLIVLPIPDKAMLQPWDLAMRFTSRETLEPLNNRGYAEFLGSLEGNRVDVVNILPKEIAKGETRFLRSDTHWTPEFMQYTAARLARHITSRRIFSANDLSADWQVYNQDVVPEGDLVRMLQLNENQSVFDKRERRTEGVKNKWTGETIVTDSDADIMLLGDSFTNIYSVGAMGWGEHGGFGEYTALTLGRAIDILAVNGRGAYGVRRELLRPGNLARLARKKVLIYQFSMRDLLDGDWRPVPLPDELPAVADTPRSAPAQQFRFTQEPAEPITQLKVVARVTKRTVIPFPYSAPYGDCLSSLSLEVETVVSGVYDDPVILGLFHAMKDNKWLNPTSYNVGDRIYMTMVPDQDKPDEFRNMQLVDDTEDITHSPFFVLSSKKLAPGEVVDPEATPQSPEKPRQPRPELASVPQRTDATRNASVVEARSIAMLETRDGIQHELNTFGDGDWSKWFDKLAPFRSDIRARVEALTANDPDAKNSFEARSPLLENYGDPLLFEISPKLYMDYLYNLDDFPAWQKSRYVVPMLRRTSEWFALRGIDFIVVPAPRMSEVYPDTMSRETPEDRLAAPHMRWLIHELIKNNVEVIDLLPTFLEYTKAKNPPLYYPVDPHWSQAGRILAVQQIRKRLSRYDFVQDAMQSDRRFRATTLKKEFHGIGYKVLTPAQLGAVKPFLMETVTIIDGKIPGLQQFALVAKNSPVLFFGDSFIHYPDPSRESSSNLIALLAKSINMPISDLSKPGQRLDEPMSRFLQNPKMLNDRKVVIFLIHNASVSDLNWRDLPQPIYDELNKQ